MAWTIEYSRGFQRAVRKDLDREIVRRMLSKLEEASKLDDPRDMAKPLTGNLKGLWSYRIAEGYRVIVDIQADRLVIFAVQAGPRRDVYED